MKVLFLGTGDSGTNTRGCTSFILTHDNGHKILFDIGHGVVSALRKNQLDVQDIGTIVISHFHLDHCGDLPFFSIPKSLPRQ